MNINDRSRQVAELLAQHDLKVVLAESCTGGLVCGALTKNPGISAHLCGAMVVYRNQTKTEYLGVSRTMLENPGPVSSEVAAKMAESVLQKTPEANISASVTGHLGPNAPAEQDGLVFIGVAWRMADQQIAPHVEVRRRQLSLAGGRDARQQQVIEEVLQSLAQSIPAAAKAALQT